jgi:hypothetical protein
MSSNPFILDSNWLGVIPPKFSCAMGYGPSNDGANTRMIRAMPLSLGGGWAGEASVVDMNFNAGLTASLIKLRICLMERIVLSMLRTRRKHMGCLLLLLK